MPMMENKSNLKLGHIFPATITGNIGLNPNLDPTYNRTQIRLYKWQSNTSKLSWNMPAMDRVDHTIQTYAYAINTAELMYNGQGNAILPEGGVGDLIWHKPVADKVAVTMAYGFCHRSILQELPPVAAHPFQEVIPIFYFHYYVQPRIVFCGTNPGLSGCCYCDGDQGQYAGCTQNCGGEGTGDQWDLSHGCHIVETSTSNPNAICNGCAGDPSSVCIDICCTFAGIPPQSVCMNYDVCLNSGGLNPTCGSNVPGCETC